MRYIFISRLEQLSLNLLIIKSRLSRGHQFPTHFFRAASILTIPNSAEIDSYLGTISQPCKWADYCSYLLQECGHMKVLEDGKRVHTFMIKSRFEANISLNNKLAVMYIKCGNLLDAREVFDLMPQRDVVSWNAIIAGYVQEGEDDAALNLFCQMQGFGMTPDEFTFGSVLRSTTKITALELGKQVHGITIKIGYELDPVVCCSLVDMYAKCHGLEDARDVFDEMRKPDLAVVNAMIAGYTHNGCDSEALEMFCQLQWAGMGPDQFTFASVLSACASMEALEEGKQVQAHIIKTGFDQDATVGNAIITMYANSGSLECAFRAFDKMPKRNTVSWNAIIAGCGLQGSCGKTLNLFIEMQKQGIKPNQFTFAGILRACANIASLEQGKQIHVFVIKTGLEADLFMASILLDMYAKCMKMDDALLIFEKMPKHNVVAWSTMIAAYAHRGQGDQAVKLFSQMRQAGMEPNQFTFASVFMACAILASLKGGKQVHAYIWKTRFASDISIGNALVDMYAKCGSIDESCKVFDTMPDRDVVTWTAMISGYSQHGLGKEAIHLFEKMQQMGLKPDYITFVGVISACSHAGLVDEGCKYFKSMSQDYGITPREEHYNCMVDLLSRAGLLDKALNFINEMPFKPSAFVWGSLLGACRIHGNMELAKHAADHLLELEPHRSGPYVQLSNIYAAAGRWDDKAKIRKVMKDKGVKKETGHSWIEIKNEVHTFSTADRSHPETEKIYAKLVELIHQMKDAGYVPDTKFVLHYT